MGSHTRILGSLCEPSTKTDRMHAVLARALALLALAAGAHGAAHVQCQDGTKLKDPSVGKRGRRRACVLVRALCRIPARSCSSVARGRARRACAPAQGCSVGR